MASAKKTSSKAQKGKKSPHPARKPTPRKAAKAPPARKPAPVRKAPPRKAAPAKKPAPKPAKAKAPPKAAKPPARPAPKVAPKPAKAPTKAAPPKASTKAPSLKAPAPRPAPKPAPAPTPAPAPSKAAAPKPAGKAAAPAKAPAAPKAAAPAPAPAAAAPPVAAPAPAPAKKAAPAAGAIAGAKTPKKKPIPTTSLAATPVIRPFVDSAAVAPAPPPPPAKPGHVDHQVLSAISYGLFAAVNKTFGFAGQSVVRNASLRMLEYGYKRGWLPPKAKEPVRALNEFFGRLETMGYAEKIHVSKRGDGYVLEVAGLADYDAVHSLKEMHYPLLPIFLGEMLQAIVDQYFQLKVTMAPIEMVDAKRGIVLPFNIHERPPPSDPARLVPYTRVDDFEE